MTDYDKEIIAQEMKMTDYEIKHDATEQVWVVSYEGRNLRAFNAWQEANDYVAECRAFDALLDLEATKEIEVPDEHLLG